MFRFLRAIKKTAKLILILAFVFVIFNISSVAQALDFSFSPITGLMEALKIAEDEATELIPDDVKSFVSGLNDKLKSVK